MLSIVWAWLQMVEQCPPGSDHYKKTKFFWNPLQLTRGIIIKTKQSLCHMNSMQINYFTNYSHFVYNLLRSDIVVWSCIYTLHVTTIFFYIEHGICDDIIIILYFITILFYAAFGSFMQNISQFIILHTMVTILIDHLIPYIFEWEVIFSHMLSFCLCTCCICIKSFQIESFLLLIIVIYCHNIAVRYKTLNKYITLLHSSCNHIME